MTIQLKKFGTMLISRQDGKEALAAFSPVLRELRGDETIEVDFEGVTTLAPSWGDEFLTPLLKQYGDRLLLVNTKGAVITAVVEFLEKIHEITFPKQK